MVKIEKIAQAIENRIPLNQTICVENELEFAAEKKRFHGVIVFV